MAKEIVVKLGVDAGAAVRGMQNARGAVVSLDQSQGRLTKGTKEANRVFIESSRVINDIPFGLAGIANNAEGVISSFRALRAQTGSTRGALKSLVSSIASPGGVIALLNIAATAAIVFGDKIVAAFNRADEAAVKTKERIEGIYEGLIEVINVPIRAQLDTGNIEETLRRARARGQAIAEALSPSGGATAGTFAGQTFALGPNASGPGLAEFVVQQRALGRVVALTREQRDELSGVLTMNRQLTAQLEEQKRVAEDTAAALGEASAAGLTLGAKGGGTGGRTGGGRSSASAGGAGGGTAAEAVDPYAALAEGLREAVKESDALAASIKAITDLSDEERQALDDTTRAIARQREELAFLQREAARRAGTAPVDAVGNFRGDQGADPSSIALGVDALTASLDNIEVRATDVADNTLNRVAYLVQEYGHTMTDALRGVADLFGVIGQESEAAFQVFKGVAIAEAVANTYRAANQVLADPTMPTVAKVFSMVGIISTGLANVAQIRAAEPYGGSGGGASGTGPAPARSGPPDIRGRSRSVAAAGIGIGYGQGAANSYRVVVEGRTARHLIREIRVEQDRHSGGTRL